MILNSFILFSLNCDKIFSCKIKFDKFFKKHHI